MLISEIYRPGNIKIDIQSSDKDRLFEELVNFISVSEKNIDKKIILDSLWEREKKMTTGIAPNIAIPHANIKNLGKTIGALAISKNGINYDSLDKKPVHLVMMLIGDENDSATHLNILKNIAMLLNIPDFYSKIISAGTPEEANEMILKYEEFIKK
jgi:nitrogen PTS system EIIA component